MFATAVYEPPGFVQKLAGVQPTAIIPSKRIYVSTSITKRSIVIIVRVLTETILLAAYNMIIAMDDTRNVN